MTTYKYKHVSWCLDPGARGPGALGALNNLVVSGACRLGAWGPGRVKHFSGVGRLAPCRLGPWASLVAAMLRVAFVYVENL